MALVQAGVGCKISGLKEKAAGNTIAPVICSGQGTVEIMAFVAVNRETESKGVGQWMGAPCQYLPLGRFITTIS